MKVFECSSNGNPHIVPDRKIINANNQLPPDDFTKQFLKREKLYSRSSSWQMDEINYNFHATSYSKTL